LVSEVIFLGTPFLHFKCVELRSAVRFYARFAGFIVFAILMLLGLAGSQYLRSSLSWLPGVSVPVFLLLPVVILLVSGFVYISAEMVYRLPTFFAGKVANLFETAFLTFLSRRQTKLFRQVVMPMLAVRGLVLRSPLDEAFWWLSGVALLATSPYFIWSVLRICTRSIPFIAVFLLLARCAADEVAPVSISSLGIAALEIISLYPAALLTILVIAIFPALVRGNCMVFGWTGFVGAAVVQVRPTSFPMVVDGTSVSLAPRRVRRGRARRQEIKWIDRIKLIHFGYYSDPDVIQEVISFLRGAAVGEPVSPGEHSSRGDLWLQSSVAAIALVAFSVEMLGSV
jgi:hypothetical protein